MKTIHPAVAQHAMEESERLREALRWYEEKVAECRKIGSLGDNARQALDRDGGFRARDAFSQQAEPAPEQDEREAVETVPRWKFHALVEHCKKQDQLISDLYARLNSVRLYDAKEVWFWQGDGCDHLESLACPVVIEADELRRLVNAAPIAQTTQGDDQ